MLKWAEVLEEDILYEAFLPEADQEGIAWHLHAVRRGHLIAQRAIPLVHRPTFGPDMADVQALEAALARLIEELSATQAPECDGDYEVRPVLISRPHPLLHSSLYALKEEFIKAAAILDLKPDWIRELLELKGSWEVRHLYPVAITGLRAVRMQRVVAFAALSKTHASLVGKSTQSLEAILKDDVDTLRTIICESGIRTE